MDVMELLTSTLIQGLIYALISYGVYITYSILDFPDLGVDGTFPLGAAVTAVLMTKGVDPWLTLPASLIVGRLAFFLAKIVGLWYNYQEQGRAIPPMGEDHPYF